MTGTDVRAALHELATQLGVQVRHHDIWGNEHVASDATLVAIVRALGVPIDDPASAADALHRKPETRPSVEPHAREPLSAPLPARAWGVFAPVHALRRAHDRGTGTLADLDTLAALLHPFGARVFATLPIVARWPEDASPYAPVSRQAWDEAVLDLDRLPGLESRSGLRDALPAVAPSNRVVDRHRVGRAVDATVTSVAAALGDDPETRRRVDDLARRRPDLVAYAEFRALADVHGRDWRTWPAPDRDAPRTGRATGAPRDAVFRHLYGQLAVEQQLRHLAQRLEERGQYLLLDLPVGCNPGGFDTWWYRDDFAVGVSVGAPPDPFFHRGQDWGLPPLRPDRAAGPLQAALRHQLAVAGALRVDHVMGLHRLWWIPVGHDATDGAYVHYPAADLFAVLVGEAVAHGAALVGEDLGTVEPGVRDDMARRGVLGAWELQFEVDASADTPLQVPDRPVVAGCNTHDMATWHAFWIGADLDEQAALGRIEHLDDERRVRGEQVHRLARRLARATGRDVPHDSATALDVALDFLGRSPAPLVLATLEDLWLEPRAQNVPGTTDEVRANWCQRTAPTLEEIPSRRDVHRRLTTLQAARL